jgi:hypothetical protein
MGSKTKGNHNWLIIFILGGVVSIILPLISISYNWFGSLPNYDTKLQVSLGIGSLLFTILASYLAHVVKKQADYANERTTAEVNLSTKIDSLTDLLLKTDVVSALNKHDLYSKLDELVLTAQEKLELMYLGEKPPANLQQNPTRDKYIKDLEDVINQEKLVITRIILFTSGNKKWIKSMAYKFKDKRFFSLYIIEKQHIPSMSIQTVDSRHTIVINTLKGVTGKKHFYTRSEDLYTIFHGYYNDTLDTTKSIKIIENGSLCRRNFNKYLK